MLRWPFENLIVKITSRSANILFLFIIYKQCAQASCLSVLLENSAWVCIYIRRFISGLMRAVIEMVIFAFVFKKISQLINKSPKKTLKTEETIKYQKLNLNYYKN